MINLQSSYSMETILKVGAKIQKKAFLKEIVGCALFSLFGAFCIGMFIYLLPEVNYPTMIAGIALLVAGAIGVRNCYKYYSPKAKLEFFNRKKPYLNTDVKFDLTIDKGESVLKIIDGCSDSLIKFENRTINAIYLFDEYIAFCMSPVSDALFDITKISKEDLKTITTLFADKIDDNRKGHKEVNRSAANRG